MGVHREGYINEEIRIKARLVAKGFEDDIKDLVTRSPTCKRESLKIVLSILTSNKWQPCSLDITTDFLQGNAIDREVYLKPPPEARQPKLWKLNTCVYGPADTARMWYLAVKEKLRSLTVAVQTLILLKQQIEWDYSHPPKLLIRKK